MRFRKSAPRASSPCLRAPNGGRGWAALGGLLTATCSVLSVNPETAAASSGLLALTLIFFSATGTATSVSTATLPLQSVLQLLSTTVVTGIAIVSALRSSHVFAQLSLPLLCTTAALALSLLAAFSQFLRFAPGIRLLLKLVAPAILLLALADPAKSPLYVAIGALLVAVFLNDFGTALLFFGVFAWGMKHFKWPRPPLVLGFTVLEVAFGLWQGWALWQWRQGEQRRPARIG